MANADALSRLSLPEMEQYVPIPGDVCLLFQQLSTTITHPFVDWEGPSPHFIQSGWTQLKLEPDLQPFYNRQNELSVVDGCILWGSRVVVPVPGCQLILQQLHVTHPGISRMKGLARSYVWWPGIDKAMEEQVRNCVKCQESLPLPTKAPLHPWELPSKPWARMHIDHAGPYLGKLYLLIVDAHSKWIEAFIVTSTSAESTITKL